MYKMKGNINKMKNKLNKKGFTLVELLAVIVVLAIIMLIAGNTIAGILKKNRVDSFMATAKMAANTAKTCSIQELDNNACLGLLDYQSSQYDITIKQASGYTDYSRYTITVEGKGKFNTIDITEYYANDNSIKEYITGDSSSTKVTGITRSAKKIVFTYELN